MSYSIGLYFKKVNSLEEGVEFANNFLDNFNFEKYVEIEKWHLLHEANDKGFALSAWQDKYAFKCLNLVNFFIDEMMKHLKFSFIYFKKQNLLGFVFQNGSVFKDQFDGWQCFQDSVDQDYDFEEWKGLSDEIDDIVSHWSSMTFADYKCFCTEIGKVLDKDDYFFNEDGSVNKERFQYNLRTKCYEDIEAKLGIERYLYQRCDTDPNTRPWTKLNLYIPQDDCRLKLRAAITKVIDTFKMEYPHLF